MKSDSGRFPVGVISTSASLGIFLLVSAWLLIAGPRNYPNLHAILDTGAVLFSAVLAYLFWDMGSRLDRPLPKLISVSFAVTATLELIHVLTTVEWSGTLAPIARASTELRPSTWPPAAYCLPIGAGSAALIARAKRPLLVPFTFGLILLAVGSVPFFGSIPKYSDPVWLGVTRPSLALVPLVWLAAAWVFWRNRYEDRAMPSLVSMAIILLPAHLSMLYSRAPHDTEAMIAHLGKVFAYSFVLLAMMRMASNDMLERIRAERELALANEALESRVAERTAELQSANCKLEDEITERRAAEQKAREQLERLNLLHQITRAIGERQDLSSILQIVVRRVEEHLPLDFCCICMREENENWVRVAHVGMGSESLAMRLALTERARVEIDENGLSQCVKGQLVYEPDIGKVPMPFPRRLSSGGLRSVVMAPLLMESQVFGILVAARTQAEGFVSGESEFLRQLSEHVALAAHQAQLNGALQRAYDDLRQTQQAVMQQERLRALGQMASGIAHDINNAISPAALYTESLLETEAGLSDRARKNLETIQRAIDDVAKTVSRMREFYRHREPQLALTSVRLNSLVEQVVDMSRARWSDIPLRSGSVIDLVTELDPNLPDISGVESEIREAMINLVFNAVDAMPDGGTLTLRTHGIRDSLRSDPSLAAGSVALEVQDTGVGMDPDTQRRCLEPFFTTKGERGTGLGLAMVYGVAQRHNADIEIDTELGKGSILRVVFPVQKKPAPGEQTITGSIPLPRQRILLVDDDPLVLKSLSDLLGQDGHVVAVANGGQAGIDAFEAAKQQGVPFNVVVTDLGMPHVDGRKVARAIRSLSPAVPIILLTGWGQRLIDEDDVPANVTRVIGKPPKMREVREALAYCYIQEQP